VEDIRAWHLERGWRDVGYHFVIRRNGRVEAGRPLDEVGAHVYGYNRVSWGVCMVGGVDRYGRSEANYTDAQYIALVALLWELHVKAPAAEILGHRDLSPDVDGDGVIEPWEWMKDCPCFDVRKWWKAVRGE